MFGVGDVDTWIAYFEFSSALDMMLYELDRLWL